MLSKNIGLHVKWFLKFESYIIIVSLRFISRQKMFNDFGELPILRIDLVVFYSIFNIFSFSKNIKDAFCICF